MACRVNIPFAKAGVGLRFVIPLASVASARLTLIPELIPPGERLMGADLAEQALEGLARAPRYASLEMCHAVDPVADVLAEDGRLASQILCGEIFEVLFRRGGRAYGRSRRDGTVGWVSESALKSRKPNPSYRVRSHGGTYPFNALVTGSEAGLDTAELVSLVAFETDAVAVARGFIEAPVKAGSRSSSVDGIGLVQQVLFACGRAAPRRAVDLAAVGRAVEPAALEAGDIIVWISGDDPAVGHAALVVDAGHVIHACANAGKVVEADLSDVMTQARKAGLLSPHYRRPTF